MVDGKTILVTGATDGIGLATARALAERGCAVIVHGRTEERAGEAAHELASTTGSRQVSSVTADFGSLAAVRAMAEQILRTCPRLDVLINNAGVAVRSRHTSADGYESTFAVNHLAPFLLTNLLLDRLRESAPARIVNVSSGAHASGRVDFDDLQMEHGFDGWQAYCNSKLANALFTCELARRVDAGEVTANFLHPGVIDTKLLHVNFGGGSPVADGRPDPGVPRPGPCSGDRHRRLFRGAAPHPCIVRGRRPPPGRRAVARQRGAHRFGVAERPTSRGERVEQRVRDDQVTRPVGMDRLRAERLGIPVLQLLPEDIVKPHESRVELDTHALDDVDVGRNQIEHLSAE